MKLPRNVSGPDLIKALTPLRYDIVRQTGSHIRLRRTGPEGEHNITIPNHDPIKLGTLNGILGDIAAHLGISKQNLVDDLFG